MLKKTFFLVLNVLLMGFWPIVHGNGWIIH